LWVEKGKKGNLGKNHTVEFICKRGKKKSSPIRPHFYSNRLVQWKRKKRRKRARYRRRRDCLTNICKKGKAERCRAKKDFIGTR